MTKEEFKNFVKKHPELINFVNTNKMTWQKFYDMYDLYGEDEKIWKSYFSVTTNINDSNKKVDNIKELFQMIRNVDLDSVQKGISGMQKAISLIQDLGLGVGADNVIKANNYEPRPMYKYFED